MAEITGAFVDVPPSRIDHVIETHLESVAAFWRPTAWCSGVTTRRPGS